MAEMILKELVRERKLEFEYEIASRGISREEEGNDIYFLAKRKLYQEEIPVEPHQAHQITQRDIDSFDDILVMENSHKKAILRNYRVEYPEKVQRLLDTDISDPWYSGDFDTVFEQLYEGCLKYLEKRI